MNIIFFSFIRFSLTPYFYPYAINDTERFYPFYTYFNFEARDIGIKNLYFSFSGNHFYSDTVSEFKIFGINLLYSKNIYFINLGRIFTYQGAGSFIDGLKIGFNLEKLEIFLYGGKRVFLPFKLDNLFYKENPYIYGTILKSLLEPFKFSLYFNIERNDFIKDAVSAGFSFKFEKFLTPFLSIGYSFIERKIERIETGLNYVCKEKFYANIKYYFEEIPFKYLYYLNEILPKKNRHRVLLNFHLRRINFLTPSFYYRFLHYEKKANYFHLRRINFLTPSFYYRFLHYEKKANYFYLNLRGKFLSLGIGYGSVGERKQVLYYLQFYYNYRDFVFNFSYKTFDDSDYSYFLNSFIAGMEYKGIKYIDFLSEIRFFTNHDYKRDLRGFFGVKFEYGG